MSVPYGMPVGGVSQPPGRVNFGWIGESFELFKAAAGVWIVAVLLSLVPSIISFIVGAAAGASGAATPPQPGENPFSTSRLLTGGLAPGVSFVLQVFSVVYRAWLLGGVYKTAMKQVRGQPISVGDLFSGGSVFLSMLAFNIVSGLAIGIGTVLCILPGLLVAGLLFPGPALIADGDSLSNAFTRSWNAMKPDMWNAAGFLVVMSLLVFASFLACGLGEFVTIPMLYLVAALAYRDMIGMPGIGPATPAYGTAAPGVWPPAPSAAPPPPQWGTPSEAPPAYPGYAPQTSPPPAPSWGTTPETPTPPPTPPASSSGSTSEEPPPNPWQPRPPQQGQ